MAGRLYRVFFLSVAIYSCFFYLKRSSEEERLNKADFVHPRSILKDTFLGGNVIPQEDNQNQNKEGNEEINQKIVINQNKLAAEIQNDDSLAEADGEGANAEDNVRHHEDAIQEGGEIENGKVDNERADPGDVQNADDGGNEFGINNEGGDVENKEIEDSGENQNKGKGNELDNGEEAKNSDGVASLEEAKLSVNKDSSTLSPTPIKDIPGRVGKNVNPHSFAYIHQPVSDFCDNKMNLFLYVESAPHCFDRRMMVRSSWGHGRFYKSLELKPKVLFVLGATDDADVQRRVDEEAYGFGDILQENFNDTYRNLSLKSVAPLKYFANNCRHIPYLMKIDDDMFANMYCVMHQMRLFPSNETKAILCIVVTGFKPIRDPTNKYHVPKEEWPFEEYPEACIGGSYIMTSQAAVELHNASYYVRRLSVEDMYVTGVLGEMIGLKRIQNLPAYQWVWEEFKDRFKEDFGGTIDNKCFSHGGPLEEYISFWNKIVEYKTNSTHNNNIG